MFKSLLPPNTTKLERVLEEIAARLSDVPIPFTRYLDPSTCPAVLLPWLAWELSVDSWDENWTEPQKRAAIQVSPYVHMKKGTPSAIRNAIESLGYTVRIFTREHERLAPHAFRIEIGVSKGINERLTDEINQLINSNKNTRSYLFKLSLTGETRGNINFGYIALSGDAVYVYPYQIEDMNCNGNFWIGICEQSVDCIEIYSQ